LESTVGSVLSETRHRGAVTCHVAVASKSTTHGAAHGGVASEKVSVMYSPYEFLLACELSIGESSVCFLEIEVRLVVCGAGEEGTKVSGSS
jgi:hypothetical protein